MRRCPSHEPIIRCLPSSRADDDHISDGQPGAPVAADYFDASGYLYQGGYTRQVDLTP